MSNKYLNVIICLALSMTALADDLYKVKIDCQADAEKLIATKAEAILLVNEGYLVLADTPASADLESCGLKIELLARNIDRNRLALDNRRDDKNAGRFPLLFVEGGLRLFQLSSGHDLMLDDGSSLVPIRDDNLPVRYRRPLSFNKDAVLAVEDLLDLIDQVSQDSVYEYLHVLQAFNGRVAGTPSNYAARDWIQDQFESFGYTNVWLDQFWSYVYGYWKQCYNVVAYKEGTVFPNRQIVVGAHHDAVPGSPGADDNGSGTVGVLEIARALADIETEMSIVFITFDSEEQGLNGAWHYADEAAANGDSIICMINMDMIGNLPNSDRAELNFGPVDAYAVLWNRLADSLVNIQGILTGSSSNSDHHAFVQNGYDVVYAAEYIFSSVYHTHRDSTTYINFDYLTRMIKGTLATCYMINLSPLPVRIISVLDAGDGQALQVNWESGDPANVDYFTVYYDTEPPTALDSLVVAGTEQSVMINDLVEGQEYGVYVVAHDNQGHRSVAIETVYGTPYTLPAMPQELTALPKYRAISLTWTGSNTELDFSHCRIIRNGEPLPYAITGTSFIDNDYSLGTDTHSYLVVAVDTDGSISDTVGYKPVFARAAALEPGRVLAVNRSTAQTPYMVAEGLTGDFLNDALSGYNFDYFSDTAYAYSTKADTLQLDDMLDYEVIILGGESARTDDFGGPAEFNGILDTIAYYLSIGGKVIMFGRGGDLYISGDITDTVFYGISSDDYAYNTHFHMSSRVQYLSSFAGTTVSSDLIGAHSQDAAYPDLAWDSMATIEHSLPWSDVTGIPCPSFGVLTGATPDVIYTYDSKSDFYITEGEPVGWRYLGEDYQYIFFEIPLSFMERSTAKTVLHLALSELLSSGPAASSIIEPDTVDVAESPPASISIYLGDFLDEKTAADVDPSSLRINGTVMPISINVLPSLPPFTGEVLQVDVSFADFMETYETIIDTMTKVYTTLWKYDGETMTHMIFGDVTFVGMSYLPGDANGDGNIDVGDPVYLINYIFKDGPAPDPPETGDANCDGATDVADAVYLVNHIFKDGPPPGCN